MSLLTVPSLFSDHMVLQRAGDVPVWGKGKAGETVTVALDGLVMEGTVGADGRWRVRLDLTGSAVGPFAMTIRSGGETIEITDVLVGEVWMAGGQSNMARGLSNTIGGPEEVAQAAGPWLRQFKVAFNPQPAPVEECEGAWTLATPEDAGNFTAVGYYFGKRLLGELGVPVGLLSASVGGTGSEPWTSIRGLDQDVDLKKTKEKMFAGLGRFRREKPVFDEAYARWLEAGGGGDTEPRDAAEFAADATGWETVELPGAVTDGPGIVWLRNEVTLTRYESLDKLPIVLGDIPGFETVYVNGREVARLTYRELIGPHVERTYSVNPEFLKAGRNELAIRIHAPAGGVTLKAAPLAQHGEMAGPWRKKIERVLPSAATPPPEAPLRSDTPQNAVSYLFNGMINPIVTYGIRGIIWYQGESNTKRAEQYRRSFPLLIEDWRFHWGRGDVPFYYVQLPAHYAKQAEPGESGWAETRDAQCLGLKLPNTAQAVTWDVGEASDLHPRDKRPPAERLALIALAREYGRDVIYSGPTYAGHAVEGGAIRVRFANADGGLVAGVLPATYDDKTLFDQALPLVRNSPGSEVEGFAICGADRKWVWADARIEGDAVVVSADAVKEPVAVRYAWADNPTGNLTNASGLPASPFRTDDFPLVTAGVRYGLP